MHDVRELNPGQIDSPVLDEVARVLQTPLLVGPEGDQIELPPDMHAFLVEIVKSLRAGDGVAIVTRHADLTTLEAANILNVSRQFVLEKLRSGELPYHQVGTLHMIKLSDVLHYRDELDIRADQALHAMVDHADANGILGDEDL